VENVNAIAYLVGLVSVILTLPRSVRVVREYQRLEVYRLGRSIGQKGPGLVYLMPIVDRAVLVDVPDNTTAIPLFKRLTGEEFSKKFPDAWNRKDTSGLIVSVVVKKETA
jgi:regulator of protease activity HflC (stomatin/prohibitin superfamily)